MSASVIAEIYLAVANLAIGGVKCRNLPEVQLSIEQADLPMRILLPSTKGDGGFVMIGTLNRIEWALRDLCLWAPIESMELADVAEPMIRYIVAYIDALKGLRGPTNQSNLTGFVFQMKPTLWNEAWYWAVDTTLSIEEYL